LLVGQGMGVFDAMRRSWELTRGHALPSSWPPSPCSRLRPSPAS
jgi:hypothetical protein